MPSYLVTGANRGIGLGISKELLKSPENFVVAAVRNLNSESIKELQSQYSQDRFAVIKIDYSDYSSIEKAAEEAAKILPNGLDYLISNAGISLQESASFETIDLKVFEEELRVNTIAPVEVIRSFLPLVRKGTAKKIALVTTIISSLGLAPNMATLAISYGATKAALNMLARKWGAVLYQEGITTVTVHPGWVDTDLGSTIKDYWAQHKPDLKPITVQQSAEDTLRVIKDAKLEENIRLYNHTGAELPW
ncbi:NAD(P)-binding protein [Daedalea quercina L-15889]|uniref:NAD(P)-binding protein n=1 Tax=Daedalea quercina L-15889 TaxID=1314783 RepID=A0A165SL63_9APHY|nr:NAD(P)-binding protein [Daedalea quercina L-15889]